MQFIDEAKIEVRAGKGGPGAASFRREKFVAFGGPDGGDGGKGGSVILIADRNKHTLLDLRFQPRWFAEDGKAGAGRLKTGKSGADLEIHLPVGTQVYDESGENLVIDLAEDGLRYVLAAGGRGGKGNTFFKSATNQAPRHSQPGEEGPAGTYTLSLKLVADIGLVGFPNAGKSTLISRISSARPKIADYPFTTLTPNLGLVRVGTDANFVVADIPGLIPGAHLGKGLGVQFLKHIERTRIIAHLVDPGQRDDEGELLGPIPTLEAINTELRAFSPELASRKQIIVVTKADTITEPDILSPLEKFAKKEGIPFAVISSVSGAGVNELVQLFYKELQASGDR